MEYDPDARILEVEFRSGHAYAYRDVPAELVDRLLASDSPGAFFNREIRTRFEYRKLHSKR
jgi:hypothetical protein